MKYSVLGYLIGEGFRNVLKNKKSTAASLIIMCATMFIFGIFFLIGENVKAVISQVEDQQGMQVFIDNDATQDEINKLGEKIKAISAVNTMEFITKEDALNIMMDRLKDNQAILEPYKKNNPFKSSYLITLTDLTKSKEVQEQILTFEKVTKITAGDDTINALVNIANGVRTASGVISILLVMISVFIIANTIKLTVHARRKEISIMKYVGATNGFIRWPFIVEGIIIGIISALISVLILGVVYNFVASKIMAGAMTNLLNLNLLQFTDMFNMLLLVYLGIGIGIGTIGSVISMRKYLEV